MLLVHNHFRRVIGNELWGVGYSEIGIRYRVWRPDSRHCVCMHRRCRDKCTGIKPWDSAVNSMSRLSFGAPWLLLLDRNIMFFNITGWTLLRWLVGTLSHGTQGRNGSPTAYKIERIDKAYLKRLWCLSKKPSFWAVKMVFGWETATWEPFE